MSASIRSVQGVVALVLVTLLASGSRAHAATRTADLSIRLDGRTVIVAGVTPGASATIFGVLHEQVGYGTRTARRARIVQDDDGDGIVRLELPATIPASSVWAAVDGSDGAIALSAPAGVELRKKALDLQGLKKDSRGEIVRLEHGRGYLEMLLVRPRVGAWALRSGDGGVADGDRTNDGKITLMSGDMRPVGGSPRAPQQFAPGDVIVLVDPFAMELFWGEVSK